MNTANVLLGRNYSFSGIVVKGNQRGRNIGFPTANISLDTDQKLIPSRGVYAVMVSIRNQLHAGMMNIGVRPTIDGTVETIEAHLFNFNDDIYGEHITISCISKIRDEIKFTSLDELKNQLQRDKQSALMLINN
jgi:riboflavin kinase/FMN adenylyltransferase